MSILQPAPLKTQPLDQGGFMIMAWVQFFTNLYDVVRGKVDIAKTVTLTAGATSTTVKDNFCSTGSHVFLTAITAHAAASTGVYIVTSKGSFVINHNNTADADKIFTYGIVG